VARFRLEFERQRLVFNRTTLWLLRRAARLLRGKKSKERNGAVDEETAPPADDLTAR